MKNLAGIFAGALLVLTIGACSQQGSEDVDAAVATPVETAEDFVARANVEYDAINKELAAADWVRATYITQDTAVLASNANEKYAEWFSGVVAQTTQYDDQELSAETRRAIYLLKLGPSLPTPSDAAKRKELTMIATELAGMYGAGQYCRNDNECISGSELEGLMQSSKDYDELEEYWTGWRTIAPPMREKYRRYVELVNEGASELGYGDLGEIFSCTRDFEFVSGFNPDVKLKRTQTIMQGASHCDFRYSMDN